MKLRFWDQQSKEDDTEKTSGKRPFFPWTRPKEESTEKTSGKRPFFPWTRPKEEGTEKTSGKRPFFPWTRPKEEGTEKTSEKLPFFPWARSKKAVSEAISEDISGAGFEAVAQDTPQVRRLWGKQFPVVNGGLAEEQLIPFVNDLLARYQALLKKQESEPPLRTFSRQILAEAEREATSVVTKARRDAQVEAARILSEAKHRAQETVTESMRKAGEITEKEVQDILLAANKKADLTETQARQLAQQFFIQAREDVKGQITAEVKEAYYRLLDTLQDLLTASQSIEAEWKTKTVELWGITPPELDEYHASHLESVNRRMFAPSAEVASPEGEDISAAPYGEVISRQEDLPPEEVAPLHIIETEATGDLDLEALLPEAPSSLTPENKSAAEIDLEENNPEEASLRELVPELKAEVELAVTSEEGGNVADPDRLTDGLSQEGSSWEVVAPAAQEPTQIEYREDNKQPSEEFAPTAPPSESIPRDVSQELSTRSKNYIGEVDLLLAPPIKVGPLSALYDELQGLPGLRVVRTSGTWDQGTIVTVSLDSPIPLLEMLSDLPEIEATSSPLSTGGFPKMSLLSRGERPGNRDRIGIAFITSEDEEETQ